MISARGRARTRRFLLTGLLLSLLIHLIAGGFFGLLSRAVNRMLPTSSLREPDVARSDVIRLEKPQPVARAVAVPHPHVQPPPPPPAPLHAQRVLPAPVEQRPEIARITVHAPHQVALSHGAGSVAVPHYNPPAGPPVPPHQYYSQQQIDAMNGAFSQAIADAHQTLAQANAAVQTAPVVTAKHYAMHFNGIHEGMNPGDGIISYIKRERIGNIVYYYTHYEYMYGDGHVEEDDIPWPFHYAINDDPFVRGDRRIPLQPPPPDYKPDRPLKPILMQFFGGPEVN